MASKSCPVIGHFGIRRSVSQEKFSSETFGVLYSIKQNFFGKDGWIFASFFFGVFMELDSILDHKQTEKNNSDTHMDCHTYVNPC